jgi:hypothetical protein
MGFATELPFPFSTSFAIGDGSMQNQILQQIGMVLDNTASS